MKVLLCHNFYQQQGGEYQVFHDEAQLLRSRGHEVIEYTRHNDEIGKLNPLGVARKTLWNPKTQSHLREIFREQKPDVMHCTNTFPLISPSAYAAAKEANVRVVQSIHNFRLICAGATLLRDEKVCEICVGKSIPWQGALHRCYRGSLPASATLVAFQTLHRFLGTWEKYVDAFVALSRFSQQKLIEGGLPANKFVVKPNFIDPDPGLGHGKGDYFVFVGRLANEKGIQVLLDAWKALKTPQTLKIVGDGPLASLVQAAAEADDRIEWLKRQPLETVYELVGDAKALIMPSIWYEVCPKTILESLAKGTPVITSKLGGMRELVDDGKTGRLFQPGNATDLAETVDSFASDDQASVLRENARAVFESRYTADQNYEMLMEIYHGPS